MSLLQRRMEMTVCDRIPQRSLTGCLTDTFCRLDHVPPSRARGRPLLRSSGQLREGLFHLGQLAHLFRMFKGTLQLADCLWPPAAFCVGKSEVSGDVRAGGCELLGGLERGDGLGKFRTPIADPT